MKHFILTLFFALFLVASMNAQQKFNYTQVGQQLNLSPEDYDTFIKKHREAELRIESYRVKYPDTPEDKVPEIQKLSIGLVYDMQKLLGKEKYAEYRKLTEGPATRPE